MAIYGSASDQIVLKRAGGNRGTPLALPLNSWVFLWLCMAVCMDGYGCIWPYMAVYGCIWLYMGVHGCIWPYMAGYGCIWPYVVVCGCIWLYIWLTRQLGCKSVQISVVFSMILRRWFASICMCFTMFVWWSVGSDLQWFAESNWKRFWVHVRRLASSLAHFHCDLSLIDS